MIKYVIKRMVLAILTAFIIISLINQKTNIFLINWSKSIHSNKKISKSVSFTTLLVNKRGLSFIKTLYICNYDF